MEEQDGRRRSNKKRFQFCTDSSRTILYLRALQGHSGRNPIDPTLQDNVLNPNNFFEYIYHIGCAVSVHSITDSGLIPEGQNSSRDRQTVFFTAADPTNKEHKDPNNIDLEAPHLAWYKQKKWKIHQDIVYWVDIPMHKNHQDPKELALTKPKMESASRHGVLGSTYILPSGKD